MCHLDKSCGAVSPERRCRNETALPVSRRDLIARVFSRLTRVLSYGQSEYVRRFGMTIDESQSSQSQRTRIEPFHRLIAEVEANIFPSYVDLRFNAPQSLLTQS